MVQVLMISPFRDGDIERFSGLEGCSIVYAPTPTDAQLAEAEVLIGFPTEEQLLKAKKLRWFQCTNAGVDKYLVLKDLFADKALTNLSGAFGQSISEFILTYTLMLYKHLPLYRDNQTAHLWKDEGRQDSPVGKEVLIIGAGNIGSEAARLFSIFNCRVTGVRRKGGAAAAYFDRIIGMDGLNEALKTADIVVSALPETPETHKLFGRERFALMKPTALFINVGRGALVDCDALAEILKEKRIAGAALDVTDPEPLPAEHPLWDCRNLILTPHITGGSFGHLTATEDALFALCRENLRRYLAGEPLLNKVDFASGYRKDGDRFGKLS